MTDSMLQLWSGCCSYPWVSSNYALSRYICGSRGDLNLTSLGQESLAATYGAGMSNACVVDMGAATTSIACVDDGLVISDTRYD